MNIRFCTVLLIFFSSRPQVEPLTDVHALIGGSNDAERRAEVPFGVAMTNKFNLYRQFFSPFIWLGVRKRVRVFRRNLTKDQRTSVLPQKKQ